MSEEIKADEVKKEEKPQEDWMTKKWRPMMAMMYMCVCTFDFILAPILWAVVQFWETQAANDAFRQWQPLTLQGAGLFHMAMGAVLGVTAWSRGQEKLAGMAGGTTTLPTSTPPLVQSPQLPHTPSVVSYVSPAPVVQVPSNLNIATVGFGGKKAPIPAEEPLL